MADDAALIKAGASTRVDIVDRHKAMFAPGVCGRTEDTFDSGEGAFITNLAGPVRAIRSYSGANSGPYTERTHFFYERREDIVTDLRVHEIPGVMDFWDYSPPPGSALHEQPQPRGRAVDGVPDTVTSGIQIWDKVDGPQGALTRATPVTNATDSAGPTTTTTTRRFRTRSRSAPAISSWGASGSWVNSTIPDTDPHNGSTKTFQGLDTLFSSAGQARRRAEPQQSGEQPADAHCDAIHELTSRRFLPRGSGSRRRGRRPSTPMSIADPPVVAPRAAAVLLVGLMLVVLLTPLVVALVALHQPRWFPTPTSRRPSSASANRQQPPAADRTGGRIGPFGPNGGPPRADQLPRPGGVELFGASAFGLMAATVAPTRLPRACLWMGYRRAAALTLGLTATLAVLTRAYGAPPHAAVEPVCRCCGGSSSCWPRVGARRRPRMLPVGVVAGTMCRRTSRISGSSAAVALCRRHAPRSRPPAAHRSRAAPALLRWGSWHSCWAS